MCADPAQVERLNTLRTRDRMRPLSPRDANEGFYRGPDIKGEGHSSLAKFKESLESSARTNHEAEAAPMDLEKEIRSLNQSVKELLGGKEKTKDLLRQSEERARQSEERVRQSEERTRRLEERTRRCQREHEDPTLVNEAQKVRPLRAI
jgi:TolA-binding protein